MIDVLFFARIREQLDVDKICLPLPQAETTVATLIQHLIELHGERWALLAADNVIKAVNQSVVEDQHSLVDGDEVAFFPPVTGG